MQSGYWTMRKCGGCTRSLPNRRGGSQWGRAAKWGDTRGKVPEVEISQTHSLIALWYPVSAFHWPNQPEVRPREPLGEVHKCQTAKPQSRVETWRGPMEEFSLIPGKILTNVHIYGMPILGRLMMMKNRNNLNTHKHAVISHNVLSKKNARCRKYI